MLTLTLTDVFILHNPYNQAEGTVQVIMIHDIHYSGL